MLIDSTDNSAPLAMDAPKTAHTAGVKRKQIGLRLTSESNRLFSEACRAVGDKKARVLASRLSAVAELSPESLLALAPRVAKGAGFDKPILVSVPLDVAAKAAEACASAGLDLSEILRAQIDQWSQDALARVEAQRQDREAHLTSPENIEKIRKARAQAFEHGWRWNAEEAAKALHMFHARKDELKRYAETNPELRALIERKPIDLALVEALAANGASVREIAEQTGLEVAELEGRAKVNGPLRKALAHPIDESALWARLLSGASLRDAAAATGTNLLRLRKASADDPVIHAAFELDAIKEAFEEIRTNLGALGEAQRSPVDALMRSRDEQLASLWATGPTGNEFATGDGPSQRERTTAGFAARLGEAAAEGAACADASAPESRATALSIAQRLLADAQDIAARLADVVARIERAAASRSEGQ